MLEILEASAEHIETIRELFLEYARSLDFDLNFQGFDSEVRLLPGDYASPRGTLLLATWNSQAAGCVGLRPLSDSIAEMKRLYVKPDFQGRGVGRCLAEAIVEQARQKGYGKMRLDTVPSMKAAITMYRSLGFYEIPSYRDNPVSGTSYLEKIL